MINPEQNKASYIAVCGLATPPLGREDCKLQAKRRAPILIFITHVPESEQPEAAELLFCPPTTCFSFTVQ